MVMNRLAVSAQSIAGLVAVTLRVLTVVGLPWRRGRDNAVGVVAIGLHGIDHAGLRGAHSPE